MNVLGIKHDYFFLRYQMRHRHIASSMDQSAPASPRSPPLRPMEVIIIPVNVYCRIMEKIYGPLYHLFDFPQISSNSGSIGTQASDTSSIASNISTSERQSRSRERKKKVSNFNTNKDQFNCKSCMKSKTYFTLENNIKIKL